jgi:peroxin-14
MIAPPTAPQLEQDKASIDAEFAKAFALIDQLGSDTESLKASEQARTERLDAALTEVETVVSELKSSAKRREEDARRVGDEVRALKDLIPKALEAQKDANDERLKDLSGQLRGLKTLISNRTGMTTSPLPQAGSASSYLSAVNGTTGGHHAQQPSQSALPTSPPPTQTTIAHDNLSRQPTATSANSTPLTSPPLSATSANIQTARPQLTKDNNSSFTAGNFPFGTGMPGSGARAAIPAWQMAAANKSAGASSTAAAAAGSSAPASGSNNAAGSSSGAK